MGLTTEDKLEIQQRVAQLYWALDSKDADGYAGGFIADSTLTHPMGETSGREGIRQWVQSYIDHGTDDGSIHAMANPVVEADPAGARFRCYVIKMNSASSPASVGTGRIEVLFARDGDSWKVSHKKVMVDNMPAAAPAS